jgi:hypothetical protein
VAPPAAAAVLRALVFSHSPRTVRPSYRFDLSLCFFVEMPDHVTMLEGAIGKATFGWTAYREVTIATCAYAFTGSDANGCATRRLIKSRRQGKRLGTRTLPSATRGVHDHRTILKAGCAMA